ncbi:LuxR C-terminal-related transcriptional regulator [Georgenia sp. Z1491]|uniref:helix-turn-helix transcriptional regulator n=1 Tax=Georgenia sp. Z1491 TaxID=3416707 RepID=UPI003CF56BC1
MPLAHAWLNPDSDGIWSDDPRSAVDEVLRAVQVERVGAVLVGTPEDRRAVTQAAVDELRAERPVHHLHGSAFVADLPYGALSILQARSGVGPEPTWYRMAKVLGEYLAPVGEEPAVVILSQPREMDPSSVTVLAQLAHQRRVVLLVQCDRMIDVPPDLAVLARSGDLAQVAVRPLTPAGTRALLVDHLGGEVSRVAATVLWRYGGGHLGRLRSIADDCVGSGRLREVDGRWVLTDGPLHGGRGVPGEDVVLRRMPDERRALLELLATRGPVETGELIRNGHGSDLDSLQAQGIVTVRRTPAGTVAAVEPVWRDRVVSALDPESRSRLEREASEQDGPARLLERAEDRLASADAAGALRLLDRARVPGRPPGGAGTPEGAGTPGGARTPGSAAAAGPDDVHGHLVWARARALLALGEVGRAQDEVDAAADDDSPCLLVLSATIAALVGDRSRTEDRLRRTADPHPGVRLDPGRPGRNQESVRLRGEATRAEILSLTDDQDGARAAAARVHAELSTYRRRGVLDSVMGPYDRAAIAASLLETALRCGDLATARGLADAILLARHGNPQAVLDAELGLVVLDLLSGRPDEAEASATGLVEQAAAVHDPQGRAVAQALVDCCRSLNPRADQGPAPRRPAGRATEPPDTHRAVPLTWGRFGWFAELARAVAGTPAPGDDAAPSRVDDVASARVDDAPARLGRLADRAGHEGLAVVEMYALLSSALLGDATVAGRLGSAVARTRAVVSGPGAELAVGVRENDPGRTRAALTAMAAIGYLAWSYGAPTSVVATLPAADARRLAEVVARTRPFGAERGGSDEPGWLRSLTPREREIAVMVVDGLSNASIARHHRISVRTVEGHLGQVYAKLHVRGRWGLSRLATDRPVLEEAGAQRT